MTLLVPNSGEEIMLEYLTGKVASTENLVLRLFTSDTTPGETDTAATYTECTIAGYSAVTLTGSSWTITPGAPTEAAYAQQTFNFTAGGTVYGYYLTRATSADLVYAERFSSAKTVVSGDDIKITPKITMD